MMGNYDNKAVHVPHRLRYIDKTIDQVAIKRFGKLDMTSREILLAYRFIIREVIVTLRAMFDLCRKIQPQLALRYRQRHAQ